MNMAPDMARTAKRNGKLPRLDAALAKVRMIINIVNGPLDRRDEQLPFIAAQPYRSIAATKSA
jgi:hypothetical protein